MVNEVRVVERLAAMYVARHQSRAIMLVGDRISEALGSGLWHKERRWRAVREVIWRRYGTTI